MKLPFCDAHLQAFFLMYQGKGLPLDLSLSNYFKSHKSLGAKDRRTIGETVYQMVRWRSLIDWACPESSSFYKRLTWYRSSAFTAAQNNSKIPEHLRLGLPEFLFNKLTTHFGLTQTREIAKILNLPAPTTIRVNLLKIKREELIKRWENTYDFQACSRSSTGIQFAKRLPLFSLPEFKDGFFEMQDEGSQLVAEAVQARPGDLVLDFCSGSGGRSLAIAPKMQGLGQIYLHDIRSSALSQAKKRLKRAGIQNAQCLSPNHRQLSLLKGKCDWVLADVPCSGTGTLRRNPDQKWRLDSSMLHRLVEEQKAIIQEALQYLHPKGRFVYATCSILPEENFAQVHNMLKLYPLELEAPPLLILPEESGPDGFFSATFRKK